MLLACRAVVWLLMLECKAHWIVQQAELEPEQDAGGQRWQSFCRKSVHATFLCDCIVRL
jgi:hypothetical protein